MDKLSSYYTLMYSTLDNVIIVDTVNDAIVQCILVYSKLQIRYSGGGVSAKAHL